MRKLIWITGATLCALAAAAVAQETPQPAEPERKGLSDLESTVSELRDETPPPEQPAATPAEPPAEQPVEQPAPTPPPVRATTRPAPPLSAAQQAALEQLTARGRQLIAIAGAGQIATQDMLSRVSNPAEAGIDGWIAEPEGNGVTVTFYADENDGPKTVFRANVLGNRVVSRDTFLGTHRPPLSRPQTRLTAARAATERLENRACTSQPFNVFVLPPARAGGPVEVYQMSAPAERGRFPLGGHFKAVVNTDGAIASSRSFAEGCPVASVTETAAGQQPQPVPVTATGSDALPSEVHMLLSRMSGRPLLVTTGDPARQWLVAGDRVAEVRGGQAVQPAAASPAPTVPRPQGR